MVKIPAIIVIFCLNCLNLFGQSIDSLEKRLNELKIHYDVVGMSIVVVKGDNVIFSKGFGVADIARQINVNENTMYRIASISKTIVGTALMQLYEKGKVIITEDISRYMGYTVRNPKYPNDSITFIQLMTHTSSLLDGSGYDSFLSASYSTNIPMIKDLLLPGGSYYTSNMWGSYRPGSGVFNYCNFAFGVLASLIEKISGERFDQYCRNHIFIPLGMNSSFNIQDVNINNMSPLYRKQGSTWVSQYDDYKGIKPAPRNLDSYKLGDNGSIFSPQGGLRTSALDLSKFMRMHMNKGAFNGVRILDDSTVSLMHKIHWSGSGLGGFYKKKGLTMHITDDLISGQTVIGHSGDAYGLLSDMYFDSKYKYGIIFIMNGGSHEEGAGVFIGVEEAIFQNIYIILENYLSSLKEQKEKHIELNQNFPNPFNPETSISFSLQKETRVKLRVYDMMGKEVRILADRMFSSGENNITWDGKDDSGKTLASGFYIYSLNCGNQIIAKKMLMLK